MRAYVINLERCHERRAYMEQQLSGLDHEFVRAVDGQNLNRGEWPSALTLGLVGAGLSHQKAYRRILESGKAGLVLEDDAVLPATMPELDVPDGGVALLYYRAHWGVKQCPLAGDGNLLTPLAPVSGATAYIITPKACEALLDFDAPARGIGPDDWQHFPIRTWCVRGRPVRAKLDFPSSVGYRKGRLIPNRVRTWNRARLERKMSRFHYCSRP